jgi:lipopolysaccharide transport system ATP-binding protein
VGTGFHTELTGRENILLNGAILGMGRSEVAAKFDEIVEFAGVGRFIDTPIKRYSTGMQTRLAFSVAAHLEPDILLVDEVLAVGDAEFQRRCLGKMRDVTTRGRTVFFVSHNMGAVKALCQRALLLEHGRLVLDGPVGAVIDRYLASGARATGGWIPQDAERSGTGEARLVRVELLDLRGRALTETTLGQPLRVALTFDVVEPIPDAVFLVGISTADGVRVSTSLSTDGGSSAAMLDRGRWRIELDLSIFLLPGRFAIDAGVYHESGEYDIDIVERAVEFDVLNVAEEGDDRYPGTVVQGFVRPQGTWAPPRAFELEEIRVGG